MGWKIVDDLIQIRGGRGYETAESLKARGEKPVPVEQALRDMRINRIFEGSTEIMHLLIAREAVDQHLQVAGDILDPETDLKAKVDVALASRPRSTRSGCRGLVTGEGQKPGSFSEFGSLAPHLRFVERSSRKLARSTFMAMGRYQAGLEKKQAVLGRIVDIGAELFAIASAVVYANTIKNEHPERAEQAFELADLFAKQARRRVDALFAAVFANDDDAGYKTAQNVLEGRYTWLEEGVADPSGDGPMIAGQPERRGRVVAVSAEGATTTDERRRAGLTVDPQIATLLERVNEAPALSGGTPEEGRGAFRTLNLLAARSRRRSRSGVGRGRIRRRRFRCGSTARRATRCARWCSSTAAAS